MHIRLRYLWRNEFHVLSVCSTSRFSTLKNRVHCIDHVTHIGAIAGVRGVAYDASCVRFDYFIFTCSRLQHCAFMRVGLLSLWHVATEGDLHL